MPVQRPWDSPNLFTPRTPLAADEDNDDEKDYAIKRFLAADKHSDPFNTIAAVKADPLGPCHWKRPLFRVHCGTFQTTSRAVLKSTDWDWT